MRIAPDPDWFLPAIWDSQDRFESKNIAATNKTFLPTVVAGGGRSPPFLWAVAHQYGESIAMFCNPASVVLGPAELAGRDEDLILKVHMGAITPHNVYVSLNGTAPEMLVVNRQSMVAELPVNALIFLPDRPNWITFHVPEQELSGQEINRNTTLTIKSISIEAVD